MLDIGKQPYLFFIFFLIAGIFLGIWLPLSYEVCSIVLLNLLIFLLFIIKIIRLKIIFSSFLLISWFILGVTVLKVNSTVSKNHYIYFIQEKKLQCLTVVVEEQNNSSVKYRKYTAEVKSISNDNKIITTQGKILLLFDKDLFKTTLTLGNEYILIAEVNEPQKYLNPHQFDYKKYLEHNYILKTAKVNKVIESKTHTSLVYKIKNFNQQMVKKIEESNLKYDSKEFLKAFILGDRAEMKKDNIEAYSKSGIMHLIAISGMHVAFIFGIVYGIMSFLFRGKYIRLRIVSCLFFVWLFGVFVGLSSSVFRSCLMITIYYFFILFKRTPNIYHSLALSAIIILLYNPNELYSIGFQLSYIAVFFMSWLSPIIIQKFRTKNNNLNTYFVEPIAVSVAAQLGTLPFVIYHFHQFSLLSIPANIIIIPYSFIITYSSIVELLIIYLPEYIQSHFSFIYDYLVDILVVFTHSISSVKSCFLSNISLNIIDLCLLVLMVLYLRFLLIDFKRKNFLYLLLILSAIQVSRILGQFEHSEQKEIIVFNNSSPLIGIREGNKLVVFKNEQEDLMKIKSFILEPYITGEKIKKIRLINYENNKKIRWNSKILLISENKNLEKVAENAVDYLILSDNFIKNDLLLNDKFKKIIVVNQKYMHNYNNSNSADTKIWYVRNQGYFKDKIVD